MRFLFRTVTLTYVRMHPLRASLTVLGVFLGVALGVGVGLLNESMLASFGDLVNGVAPKSDCTVTAPSRAGMEPGVLDTLTALPAVRAAAPVVRVTGFLAGHPEETLLVLGVDALADKDFRAGFHGADGVDALGFLNQPGAALVARSLAARRGLSPGDALTVVAQGAPRTFTVRAVVDEEGAGKVYGGNLVIVDLYGSEEALGRGGRLDQIDLLAKPGVSPAALRAAVAAALGPGFTVEQPGHNRQAAQMLAGIAKTTAILGTLALFVGMFLIFNTLSTSVAQRRREIAVLRALGTSRGQVLALFLAEAAFLGLVGSLLGALGGFALAKLLLHQYAAAISNLYFQAHPEVVKLSPGLVAAYGALGTGAALVAAAWPAWRAAATSPLDALGDSPFETARVRGFRRAFGLGIIAVAVEALVFTRAASDASGRLGLLSTLLGFAALALLTPAAVMLLGHALSPLFRRFVGLEARLGADNLMRSLGRTAVTVAALMVGITLAVSIGGSFISLSVSIDDWITTGVTQDLMVRGSANLPGVNAVSLPEGMERELLAVPGVADVGTFREMPVQLAQGGTVQLLAMGTPALFRHDTRRWFEGDPVAGRKQASGRGYAVISENVSVRYGLHPGDKLVLRSPKGPVSFVVAGVHVDYASDLGSVVVNRDDYVAAFGDRDLDAFNVWLAPGADAAAVRAAIRRRFAGAQLFVQTNTEFRAEIHQATRQLFGLADVVQLLVIVIAIVGIVNTLLVSILDRTRELGVMRAVGFTRAQLARVILWEGAIMGAMAGLLGALSGSVFAMSIIHLVNRQLVGWSTAYVFPTAVVAKGFAVAVVSAVLAGLYPARRAAKLNIVEAMEYQ
jgi:putative ABC transport system permease protein